jgi:hypothetical protein
LLTGWRQLAGKKLGLGFIVQESLIISNEHAFPQSEFKRPKTQIALAGSMHSMLSNSTCQNHRQSRLILS